ncbi:hypothetical protein [Streptomyces sp. NPDC093707]|uniref:hypothetical protein n=1 Tax=Streptomyces sp. NPDC093707 TaxID=3154984 RepID=UPI00344E478F
MYASVRHGFVHVLGWAVVGAVLLGVVAVGPARAATPGARAVDVPAGVTAGVAVFDRQTATFTEQFNPHMQFRSASVVKILLALDHLWDRDPGSLPAADRDRLASMLRSSDDDAASAYWTEGGGSTIVDRMVARLHLTETAGPPPDYPGFWGYTALSAADTVRIYRYLLDSAPAAVRDLVMGDLRAATRCGADGFDQRFGIPSSFERPWAVKQGWSGFGSSDDCTGNATASSAAPVTPVGAGGVDLSRKALHSTGTVGAGDRTIVAVFTLQPRDTGFGAAYTNLNRLVRSLQNVPGARRPSGSWFDTWGSGVRVRSDATTGSAALATLPAGVEALVACQKQGESVTEGPYTNDWWAYLPLYGGYVSNIYMKSPGSKLPGVPGC